jgi:hypothetical protein
MPAMKHTCKSNAKMRYDLKCVMFVAFIMTLAEDLLLKSVSKEYDEKLIKLLRGYEEKIVALDAEAFTAETISIPGLPLDENVFQMACDNI